MLSVCFLAFTPPSFSDFLRLPQWCFLSSFFFFFPSFPWEALSPLYQFCVVFISRLLPDGLSQRSAKVFWDFMYVKVTWVDPIVQLGLCLVRVLWVSSVSIAPVLEIIGPFYSGTLQNGILIVWCGLQLYAFLVQQQWSSPI